MAVIDPDKFAEENPNSRFRISNVAQFAPGTCILCKSAGGDGRQFIDLGITVEWFGAMYFCTFCITEAASLLGLGDISALKEMSAERSEKYQKALFANAELREQLNATRILLRNCHCDDSNPSYRDVVDVSVVEEADDSASEITGDSDESGSVEEPGDISEASGDDESVSDESAKPKRGRRSSASVE